MKRSTTDNPAPLEYAAFAVADARLLPLTLLRSYAELDLNSTEALILLRLLAYCYQSGVLTAADIRREFNLEGEDARLLVRPFEDRRLLEYDPGQEQWYCQGLRQELYLLWARQVRDRGESKADSFDLTPLLGSVSGPDEAKRALAHLYRRFEQELCRPLKYAESDRLRCWVDEENIAPELIEEALKRAVLRDKCSLAYIGSILKSWQKKHLTTLEQVLTLDLPPEEAEKKPKPAKKTASGVSKYAGVKEN